MPTTASLAIAALLALSPIDLPRFVLPGWHETPAERRARYTSIAEDVGAVADAACKDRGDGCRRWAVATLAGIAAHESGFAPDVDAGKCYRGPGFETRCDGGQSVSIFQLRAGGEEGALYATDRRAAAREALRRATRSWNGCHKLEPALRWAVYAGGSCTNPTAQKRSRELDAYIQKALRAMSKPVVQEVADGAG